ncbi:hypothetical protein DICPUDRAFT_93154 [Dictyostelium purpureum]|uniref:Uncharacterized protein n=1 Tax=Dictyostelium purpureum TaxID=5786 RepID=F1A333_DICPU|nr:uncharacterized protein DICPUDRAFT_93154 [Dictyostelium purpureum]EGC29390.1 hypothetical protein DICPUDRAFT_93154 [Dictyostelium purpureum]|eukprot:XP_003294077.1 hypothetical protein DICPUDRAFT_93154 [Dictyostelium purpureum]
MQGPWILDPDFSVSDIKTSSDGPTIIKVEVDEYTLQFTSTFTQPETYEGKKPEEISRDFKGGRLTVLNLGNTPVKFFII